MQGGMATRVDRECLKQLLHTPTDTRICREHTHTHAHIYPMSCRNPLTLTMWVLDEKWCCHRNQLRHTLGCLWQIHLYTEVRVHWRQWCVGGQLAHPDNQLERVYDEKYDVFMRYAGQVTQTGEVVGQKLLQQLGMLSRHELTTKAMECKIHTHKNFKCIQTYIYAHISTIPITNKWRWDRWFYYD